MDDPDGMLAQAHASGVSLQQHVNGNTADKSWETTTPIPPEVVAACNPVAIMDWWRDHQMPHRPKQHDLAHAQGEAEGLLRGVRRHPHY